MGGEVPTSRFRAGGDTRLRSEAVQDYVNWQGATP